MKTSRIQVKISELIALWETGNLIIFDGQRGLVWNAKKKQKLITSILNGEGMPELLLGQRKNSTKLEILDGQQRITTIISFIKEDAFKTEKSTHLEEEVRSKLYSKLTPEIQDKILNTQISLELKTECTLENLVSLYQNRNAGVPLNKEDKAKATPGPINDYMYRERKSRDIGAIFNQESLKKAKKAQEFSRMLVSAMVHTGQIILNTPLYDTSYKVLATKRAEFNDGKKEVSQETKAVLSEAINTLSYARSGYLVSSPLVTVSFVQFVMGNIDFFRSLTPEKMESFMVNMEASIDSKTPDELSINHSWDTGEANRTRIKVFESAMRNWQALNKQ